MPFLFAWLCELLEELQTRSHERTLTTNRVQSYEARIIYHWYERYNHKIDRTGPSAIAFLSCLLPERRPDRVYNLQVKRLSRIFGRALALGATRALKLNQWQEHDGPDFATSVELTMKECENNKPDNGKEVTLEEIDETLNLIAARARSSSSMLRAKLADALPTQLLTPILIRLQSHEGKWLVRMLLKNYAPVQIPEREILHGFHFMLPNLLNLQNSFDAAITTLAHRDIRGLPPRPDLTFERSLQPLISQHMQPRLGVMIRRQPYEKARSIKHCCNIANGRLMSVERKYDGEYCQIHVDMSRGHDCIQIFSKSGKDSTTDRVRLHTTIKDALRIGQNGCGVREKCIVEGELMVWNDIRKAIQPFHKIRKYVKHGGRDIGTLQDSPKKPEEWLMIAFYDILVLDNRMLLNESNKNRRRYLKSILHTTEGRAIICERKIINFNSSHSSESMRAFFAGAITQRWEGLVLKGFDDPYFSWTNQNRCIKLKKDYITGLGNIADLCIIGARRDPQAEQQINRGPLKWTSFYVGAICNMEAIRRYDKKPEIKIIDELAQHNMPVTELLSLNQLGQLYEVEYALEIAEFTVEMCRSDVPLPHVLFKRPFIVEVMGAGFDKPRDASFFTLRFPRKTDGKIKLHADRTLVDTTSYDQLQRMAQDSLLVAVGEDVHEDVSWIKRLIRADGMKRKTDSIPRDRTPASGLVSPSAKSLSTVSPGARSVSQIYVRSDTEEPERSSITQCADRSDTTINIRYNTSQETPQNSLPARLRHKNPLKVDKRRAFKPDGDKETSRSGKRQCLQTVDNSNGQAASVIPDDIRGKGPLGCQHLSPSSKTIVQVARSPRNQEENMTAFSSSTEFCLPPRSSMRDSSLIPKSPSANCSQITPESTMVMRQMLSICHRPDYITTQQSSTKFSGSRIFQHSLTPISFGPNIVTSNNLVLLPTPLANSQVEQTQCVKPMEFSKNLPLPLSNDQTNETAEDLHQRYDNTSMNLEFTKVAGEGEERQNEDHYNELEEADKTVTNGEPVEIAVNDETDEIDETAINGRPNRLNRSIQVYGNGIQPITFTNSAPQIAQPILIVRTPTWPERDYPILNRAHGSFTYNACHFLSSIDADIDKGSPEIHNYHIALTSGLDMVEAANALYQTFVPELHRRITTTTPSLCISGGVQQYNNRILLFDLPILNNPIFDDGTITIERLRSLNYRSRDGQGRLVFLGLLQFSVGGEGENELISIDVDYELGWTG